MRVLTVNTDIVVVELDDLAQAIALHHSLMQTPIPGVHEVVPASRTVMIRFHPSVIRATHLAELIGQRDVSAPLASDGELVRVPVHYTGEDLGEVARLTGLSPDEVIARHTGAIYTVAFTGFAPGFVYLVGGDPCLNVPRRAVPRIAIPSGAVGLAGIYSGIYPRTSPGGWQIIGQTDVPMFDLANDPPVLLRPGMRVQFTAAEQASSAGIGPSVESHQAQTSDQAKDAPDMPAQLPADRAAATATAARTLVIEEPGLAATVQDLGRPGHADLGISRSGALDHDSLRCASRLVGNHSDAACIETYGGLRVRAMGEQVLAIAGAEVDATIDASRIDAGDADTDRSRPAPHGHAFALGDGEVLDIGFPKQGAVAYLGIRGGLDIEPVLGSLSSDILSDLGPRPLRAGDELPVRAWTSGVVAVSEDDAGSSICGSDAHRPHGLFGQDEGVSLDVVLGPRDEMFTEAAVTALLEQEWEVTPQSNRVGLRLHGDQPLERTDDSELESEPMASGALEVPPGGQPVVFMADHPLTGGYPVIGSVASWDLNRAGQVPIGARIRFRLAQSDEQAGNGALGAPDEENG